MIADVWERRTSEIAQNVVVGLFPDARRRPTVVDRADAFLADRPSRRRCAGWSPRAATTCSVRCAASARDAQPGPDPARTGDVDQLVRVETRRSAGGRTA